MSIDKEMAAHLEELQGRVERGELTNLEDVVFLLQEIGHLDSLIDKMLSKGDGE